MAVKDDILLLLEHNKGTYVSGQAMANTLSVSRNAVWKSIDRLKSEGYMICSGNGGYMLKEDSDRLVAKRIEELLEDSDEPGEHFNIHVMNSVDSTNNECKRRLMAGEHDFAVLSETQVTGRGRNGKNFFSPSESGLYMSVALQKNVPFEDAVKITTYTAVCVVETLKEFSGQDCRIKWVNDILLNGKKVCGILSEAITDIESGRITDVVIGIGINLHPSKLPPELESVAGFVDCGPVKNEIAASLIRKLNGFDPLDQEHMEKYRRYSAVIGKNITFQEQGRMVEGTAVDIDDAGGLVVLTEEGRKTLRAGEISVRLS